ncbi:non-ribosomal peptide synthetase [Gloeocapsa sp. PCC 73106]|uniref:non-ribosomal peptide synthetase n=1 Tax=Gloeocapsa sp. PCC 73106 TaxID=102232 RepID=UPI0002AC0C9D|nr:non-ribosomal peptide synthetase [Gloeocapsa sp. PCC 73106]ELR97626.1 amino acid adenylation enzyme/thioester reductase family protein [Gloeocapsa sp. PCC 73106]
MNKANPIEDIYPLSPMQMGILFHTLLNPDVGIYIPQICLTLEGHLDSYLLKQAWEKVLIRHGVLRTAFNWEKRDKPFQIVYRQVNLPWFESDWRNHSTSEQKQLLAEFLEQDRKQNFDLKKPPLIRLNLMRLSEEHYYLIWTLHHVILDGWSSGLVIKDVFSLYQNQNLSQTRPYGEYIAWLNQQDQNAAQQFWQNKLKDFTTPLNLKIDRHSQTTGCDEQQISLSPTTFQSFIKKHQITLNTLIQGVFAILLSHYCGEEDIVFGTTVAGRPPALMRVESMVGLFINTLPVRIQVPYQASLIPWLKNIQTQQIEALQYEYSSLLHIHSLSNVPTGLPLFESILVFENYPVDLSFTHQNQDLIVRGVDFVEWTSFPLTVLISSGAQLSIKIKYQRDYFSGEIITRMLTHFQTLLEAIIINPEQSLGQIPLLTKSEQEQLIFTWNDTQKDYPRDQCLHEGFEQQVEKTPDTIAVIFEDQQLTYLELNSKANQLAHYLQTLGVKPGIFVGICVERSLEMIIGILGILKAGGAYVPIDSTYPLERQSFMLTDAQISILLTQSHISLVHPLQKILLDDDWGLISQYPSFNTVSEITSEADVYVIYTSGSTGKPKGVINTHRALMNRLVWMQNTYQLTADDKVLQKTSISFDVSVWEIFWPLLEGVCLVLAKPEGQKDTSYLVQLIIEQQITTLHFVPSMLRVFLEESKVKDCHSIKRVICSGEALNPELQQDFFQYLNAELHNLYGPTEAAIDVTYWSCLPTASITLIGRPIANTQIYLLDKHAQLVPIGVPGELHIGGDGLAIGYLNRPDLTAEKFIPNPYLAGSRLYKTGDLARYLANGMIEYLGRVDYQVKIRGFRIELGEIEAILTQYPSVKEAVVMVQNQYLVAYVIGEQEAIFLPELRHFLTEKLPQYMIPTTFIILEKFPLSVNGKRDRKALPKASYSRTEYVAPRNPTEEKIAAIWQEVLKIEQIDIYDNFFEIGGNSLSAIRVNSRLCQTFDLELPLRTLFEKTTIATLAERIEVMHMTFINLQ